MANHAAWLEDHWEMPNGELATRVGDLALMHSIRGPSVHIFSNHA